MHKEDEEMSHEKKRGILMGIGICLMAVGLLVVISAVQGEARERTDLPRHYPDEFSGEGQIDRIATDEIVINDCFYRFSKHPMFNSYTHVNVSIKQFHEGDSVYYIKNDKGEIESLWEKR
jgi:hypothetical protein